MFSTTSQRHLGAEVCITSVITLIMSLIFHLAQDSGSSHLAGNVTLYNSNVCGSVPSVAHSLLQFFHLLPQFCSQFQHISIETSYQDNCRLFPHACHLLLSSHPSAQVTTLPVLNGCLFWVLYFFMLFFFACTYSNW